MSGAIVTVSVAWATRAVQDVVALALPAGATAGEAIARSGLLEHYRVDRSAVRAGIGGRLVRDDAVLRDGDRVEILRPLAVDPKEARRLRAEARSHAAGGRVPRR